jgi:DNA polymerase-3 subunit gamma/tau
MRDAVGLLDQLVPLASGPISLDSARSLLGIADPRLLDGLLDDVLAGRAEQALTELNRVYAEGAELRQVVRGLMEGCRDRLVAALTRHDQATARRLSGVLDALLHLDGEVRRHAEPRFLVEATLVRLAVEPAAATPPATASAATPAAAPPAATNPPAAAPPTAPASREPATRPAAPVSGAPGGLPAVDPAAAPSDGWRGVLEALSPKVRAYFREARPQVEGDTLTLSFPYGFHHKMASEHVGQIEPLVRAWLGESARLDLRLQSAARAAEAASPVERPLAPEEDPLIKAAERKLEGRVVRVRPLKETE